MWARITTSKNWNINGKPDKYLILNYRWFCLTYEFNYSLNSYILLTFHIKNSHTSRKVFCKMFSNKHDVRQEMLALLMRYLLHLLIIFGENSKPSTYLLNRQHTWKIVFDQSFGYRHKVFPGQYHLAQTILN